MDGHESRVRNPAGEDAEKPLPHDGERDASGGMVQRSRRDVGHHGVEERRADGRDPEAAERVLLDEPVLD